MNIFKVVCLESFAKFKEGQLYEVIEVARPDSNTEYFRIGNSWYNSLCFKSIKKVRQEKLKKLGL